MITRIKIDGFKSFKDFEMEFSPLTLIAGANGSGKSNLFDALHLLARLAEVDLKTAFNEQRGDADELFTKLDDGEYVREMRFEVEMLVPATVVDNWGGTSELRYKRLRYGLAIARTNSESGFRGLKIVSESLERIRSDEDAWAKRLLGSKRKNVWKSELSGGTPRPFITTEELHGKIAIKVRQDGGRGGRDTLANAAMQTVLSGINSVDFAHAYAAKEEMRNWRFLQLNPEDLREPTRQDVGLRDVVTESGKNLAAALFRIKQNDPYALKVISRKLNSFLPNFVDVEVLDDKANRQFVIKLISEDGKEFSSRVLSEGTLRILALCIFLCDESHAGLLCFEEPENGIHPYRITAMAELLRDLASDFDHAVLRQVIVNTHSPRLVSSMLKWIGDVNVSVFFTNQHTLAFKTAEKKYKLKVTRSEKVDLNSSLLPKLLPNPARLTLAEVARYLGEDDIEAVQKEVLK
jgi:predicted ATPase